MNHLALTHTRAGWDLCALGLMHNISISAKNDLDDLDDLSEV